MSDQTTSLSVTRSTIAGALTLGIVFAACWIGAFIKVLPVSHMFLQLFTTEPMTSAAALAEGMLWSVVFGGLIGLLFAALYRFAPIGRT
jgi:hypothetical protein